MRVIVAMESRFVRDPGGDVWSATMSASFWARYLAVFDEVLVAARVLPVDCPPDGWHRVSRPGVTFHPIPYYVGPAQFLRRWRHVRRSVARLVESGDAVVLRIGKQVASIIAATLDGTGHPFAVEVVGDPWDVFAPGAVRHPLRPFFRRHFARQMRRQCRRAAVAAYVTERVLQTRYPAGPDAFSTHYSSIDLPPDAYVDAPRALAALDPPVRLAFVGSVEQLYKAPDVLLRAVRIVSDRDLAIELDAVGGGRNLAVLKALARELGIEGRVRFHGELPSGDAIRRLLDAADLFVLPSRQEGLPRATLEAMARALPCIGTTVGGFPELLPAASLVPPNDAEALAAAIIRLVTDRTLMATESARNLARSRDFRSDVLQSRREECYRRLASATAAYAATAARP